MLDTPKQATGVLFLGKVISTYLRREDLPHGRDLLSQYKIM
jgi:hypothetical protein